jgi:hypothetical protein
LFCLVFNDRQHFGLDFFGDDFAFRGDFGGHWEGEVAATGSDVGDNHSVFEVEGFEEKLGGFFFVALGAIQPGGGFVAHVVRHLAAHIAVADPVGIVVVHLDVFGPLGLEEEKGGGEDHCFMLRDESLTGTTFRQYFLGAGQSLSGRESDQSSRKRVGRLGRRLNR